MGDRGNIVVRGRKGDAPVYLYTHWGGSEIEEDLRRALSRRERWDDPAYLTRIIFCQMVVQDLDGTTGYGISTELADNQNDILLVDCEKQRVFRCSGDNIKKTKKSWTFEEFLEAKYGKE